MFEFFEFMHPLCKTNTDAFHASLLLIPLLLVDRNIAVIQVENVAQDRD